MSDLFPSRLADVPLQMRIYYHHVPFSAEKYALLERERMREVDNGLAETVSDPFWLPAIEYQQLLDRLEKANPSQYRHELLNMRRAEIRYFVSEACLEEFTAHREDGDYHIYDATMKVLKEYDAASDPTLQVLIEQAVRQDVEMPVLRAEAEKAAREYLAELDNEDDDDDDDEDD
jgi:hypothetical protein